MFGSKAKCCTSKYYTVKHSIHKAIFYSQKGFILTFSKPRNLSPFKPLKFSIQQTAPFLKRLSKISPKGANFHLAFFQKHEKVQNSPQKKFIKKTSQCFLKRIEMFFEKNRDDFERGNAPVQKSSRPLFFTSFVYTFARLSVYFY